MGVCELCQGCNKDKKDGIEGKSLPLITNAFLVLTERCNLACKYCFVNQNPREMTYEIAFKAAQFIFENAEKTEQVPNICFFGGEPLLKWDSIIVPLVRYIREEYKKPCAINMTTNGTLITEDKLKFMKENDVLFMLSLDGTKESQNINRVYHNEKPSFDDIPLDLILKYFPLTTVRGTFDCNNLHLLAESMMFVHNTGFDTSFFYPNVTGNWTDNLFKMLKEQLRIFSDFFIEQARSGKIIHHKALEMKIRECVKLNTYIANDIKYAELGENSLLSKCGIGVNNCCSVATNGDIYGCQEMPSNYMCGEENIFMFGDIFGGVDTQKRNRLVEQFSAKSINGEEYGGCEKCRLNRICHSGCSATNYRYSGSFTTPPRMHCEFNNILFEEAEYIIKVLGEERNESFRNEYFLMNGNRSGGVVHAK